VLTSRVSTGLFTSRLILCKRAARPASPWVALAHLLHLEGRGAQVRLAQAKEIDRGYLNAVVKGRKPAAEEIRVRIADHFGMLYEDMLALGRKVQEGSAVDVTATKAVLPDQQAERMPSADSIGGRQEDHVAETIRKALEILAEQAEYREALSRVIAAMHRAMVVGNTGKVLPEGNRLQVMEERLAQLEGVVLKDGQRELP
jgi:plasmid maintenance system antidote protein VapI